MGGLKYVKHTPLTRGEGVPPHTGGWIEIGESLKEELVIFVPPHTGGWIEILYVMIRV